MKPRILIALLSFALLVSCVTLQPEKASASGDGCEKEKIKVSLVSGQAIAALARYIYTETEYGKISDKRYDSWHWDLPMLQGHVYGEYLRLRISAEDFMTQITSSVSQESQVTFDPCRFPYLPRMLDLTYSFYSLGETETVPSAVLESLEVYRLVKDEREFSNEYVTVLSYAFLIREKLHPELRKKIESYFPQDVTRFNSRREFFRKFEQSFMALTK